MHSLYANTVPFYLRDLCILRLWCPLGSWASPLPSGGKDVPWTVGTSVVGALGLWLCNNKLWLSSNEKAGLGSLRLSFYSV